MPGRIGLDADDHLFIEKIRRTGKLNSSALDGWSSDGYPWDDRSEDELRVIGNKRDKLRARVLREQREQRKEFLDEETERFKRARIRQQKEARLRAEEKAQARREYEAEQRQQQEAFRVRQEIWENEQALWHLQNEREQAEALAKWAQTQMELQLREAQRQQEEADQKYRDELRMLLEKERAKLDCPQCGWTMRTDPAFYDGRRWFCGRCGFTRE